MTGDHLIENNPRNWTQFRGDEIEKIYYDISEVAAMFGVATSAIRFWQSEFGFCIKKNRRGERKFTSEDIEVVRKIHHLLKVEMYTLPGAKRQMRMNRQ